MRVLVVGAGAAGLISARTLHSFGFEVTVLERAARVGGLWAVSRGAPPSPVYRDLVTNIPKECMATSDLPFPSSLPSFVTAADMEAYLESYSALLPASVDLRLSTALERLVPTAPRSAGTAWDAAWRSTAAAAAPATGGGRFDAVLLANGHFGVPLSFAGSSGAEEDEASAWAGRVPPLLPSAPAPPRSRALRLSPVRGSWCLTRV